MSLKSVRTLTAAQLAKKWNLSLAEVKRLIAYGASVEHEHTKSAKEAAEIARDHLSERPDYYKQLKKIEEESGTGGVRGLGYVTGDPSVDDLVQKYIDTNAMSYEDENGNKLTWIKKNTDGHNAVGFKAFDPTELTKTTKTKLKESLGSDYGTSAVPVIGDLTGNTRKVAKVEEKNDLKGTCWKGYTAKGLKKKGNRMVPNCIPVSEQGSPANPARYTERPMYERNDKLSSGEVERGIYEVSAELVGKVSNARFWRGEAPSKTLSRAINKKFIESGKKKDDTPFEGGHKRSHEKSSTHVHRLAVNAMKKYQTEETTMDTKELVNEALDNILENNLVDMKENFLAALQEKAMEKLEEKKKEIASSYFGQ